MKKIMILVLFCISLQSIGVKIADGIEEKIAYDSFYFRLLFSNCIKGMKENDAMARYAMACDYAYMYNPDDKILELSEVILDSLITRGYPSYGWTEENRYDSFQDGSLNTLNTTYTYQTTSVGKAFLLHYDITEKEKYKEICYKIADHLLDSIGYWSSDSQICMWYSSSPYDRKYRVHNVNAYTMSFLTKLDYSRYEEVIKKMIDFELSTYNGRWYYCEDLKNRGYNDIVHAAMMGTSMQDMYNITNDNRFSIIYADIRNKLRRKYIKEKTIYCDGTRSTGRAELIYLLNDNGLFDKINLNDFWNDPSLAWLICSYFYVRKNSIASDNKTGGMRKLSQETLSIILITCLIVQLIILLVIIKKLWRTILLQVE